MLEGGGAGEGGLTFILGALVWVLNGYKVVYFTRTQNHKLALYPAIGSSGPSSFIFFFFFLLLIFVYNTVLFASQLLPPSSLNSIMNE